MTVITGPGELVAAVPTMLGFTPRESVVVIPVREDGRVGAVLRADRADLLSEAGSALAQEIAFHAARESARMVMLVVYTGVAVRWGCPALDVLRDHLAGTVATVETWAVAKGRYFSPGCDDAECCPERGRTMPQGRARSAVPTDTKAPAEQRRRAARAARGWEARARGGGGLRAEGLETWRSAIARIRWEAPQLGRLAAALDDVRVRDAALISLIPGADRAAEDALHGLDTPAIAAALGTGLRPGAALDPGTLDTAAELLTAILSHAPRRRCAAPAAMLAVLAWWQGEAHLALAWCERAREADPGYRLANLVTALVLSAPSGS